MIVNIDRNKMMNSYRVELYLNGELLDSHGDKKLISHLPIRDKSVSYLKWLIIGYWFVYEREAIRFLQVIVYVLL